MKTKKTLNILNIISAFLMLVTAMLSVLNIGPSTSPMFVYISSQETINFVSTALITFALFVGTYLIFSILLKRIHSFSQLGLNILLIFLASDVLLGGNIAYMASTVFAIMVLIINIINNKKRAK